jgi:hypothetical protein
VAAAEGRADEALERAGEAADLEARGADLELTYGMGGLALAEVLDARGEGDRARAALVPVVRRLTAVAATIASPEDRDRFWHRPLPNASLGRLAAKLGL